jgi:putative transposase
MTPDPDMRHLAAVFGEVCEDVEAQLVEFNGETDHVHLLVNYPSYVAGSVGGAPLNVLRQYIDNQQPPVEAAPRTPVPPRPEQRGISAKALR